MSKESRFHMMEALTHTKLGVVTLIFICGLLLVALWVKDPEITAAELVSKCSDAPDRSACYESSLPALYPRHSLDRIFNLVREIRELDPEYQFCHVLGHKLGERVVAEDPERWLEFIAKNPPDGLCSNGFIHGVAGGRFRAEVLDEETLTALIPDFSRACEAHSGWRPTSLDKAMCYHGVGHLYVFITDARIPKALSLCENTASPDFRRVCREGVFMQIFQPLEPDDYLMLERMEVRPSTTTVRSFCSRFGKDEHEGACLRESWPFFREEIVSGTGVVDFCSGQPNPDEENACYDTVGAIIGRMNLEHPETAAGACAVLPHARRVLCFVAVAQAVLEENRSESERAFSLCALAPLDIKENCRQILLGRADFIFGTGGRDKDRFCSVFGGITEDKCWGQ